tara:strand:+ start:80 stop:583 length:504 start_codon:yes stop_codon:yes gene_type:complete
MGRLSKVSRFIVAFVFFCFCIFANSENTFAASKINNSDQSQEIKRSFESLRDLDYQTWQIIVYPTSRVSKNLILRIVGYPGSLRFDHPTNLIVNSGRKRWELKDITLKNKVNSEAMDDSTAEFDISPLISELDKNRPLRLCLPGLINDLPIPPYLVSEWRSLVERND